MSGGEVLQRIWADPDTRRIPVAVLSADATLRQQQRLLSAGAVAYLTKPLDVAALLRVIDDRLGQARTVSDRTRACRRRRGSVVDDDRFFRQACEAGLRQRGFEVVTADDGERARWRATPHVDLILLDQLMPKMPGIEVLRALKSRPETAAIPVVILSNSSREDDKQQALQLGAAGYYMKANLSLRELAVQVDQLVQAQAVRQSDEPQTPDGRVPQ